MDSARPGVIYFPLPYLEREIVKNPRPIDKLGVPEAAADEQIAEGYGQIRRQLGVPFVPTIYRILAQCPEPFLVAVDALEDIVKLAEHTDFSRRVRQQSRAALNESRCCLPEGVELPEPFETVMANYAAANPIGLIFSLSMVGRPSQPHPGVMDSTIPATADTDLSADIVACHGDVILPGFWRDAMAWPELAQELWTCTRTHAHEGHLERARDSVLDFAAAATSGTAVDAMAEKLRPMMPADLVEILAWFPTGISIMIVEVEWLLGARREAVEAAGASA
jgi:hypothetical protein